MNFIGNRAVVLVRDSNEWIRGKAGLGCIWVGGFGWEGGGEIWILRHSVSGVCGTLLMLRLIVPCNQILMKLKKFAVRGNQG